MKINLILFVFFLMACLVIQGKGKLLWVLFFLLSSLVNLYLQFNCIDCVMLFFSANCREHKNCKPSRALKTGEVCFDNCDRYRCQADGTYFVHKWVLVFFRIKNCIWIIAYKTIKQLYIFKIWITDVQAIRTMNDRNKWQHDYT